VFHVIFGFVLNRIVVAPIKALAEKSREISSGNLAARIRLKRKNEIGMLGNAFDSMADSIQDKITRLDDQNKKMKMELVMARQVQKSIYPSEKDFEKFSIAVYHKPLIEVSGDFHDVFPLENGRYGVFIADVSGHGVSAALITMLIKQIFEKMSVKYTDTKSLFRYMNDELGDLVTTFDKYFTAFYLILDKDNRMTFSNAGHPKIYLARAEGSKLYELDTDGVFIGFSKDMSPKFASKRIQLHPKDKIFLFTDGITEAPDKNMDQYGLKRLLDTARKHSNEPCGTLLESILADFHSFADESKRRDDETLMIIEIKDTATN
jgi:sigma-B regulation protein RsbU (phosphoserine phosphatase)